MNRPQRQEFEADYLTHYINLVPGEDALKTMEELLVSSQHFFKNLTEEQGNYRYAAQKWSIKEVLGHIIDTERIFTYRALCIARGEKKSLPGYEQDDYVKEAQFDKRSLKDLVNEYRAVKEASIALYKSLSFENLSQKGTANSKFITPRVLAYATTGHELHHMLVLKEKYL